MLPSLSGTLLPPEAKMQFSKTGIKNSLKFAMLAERKNFESKSERVKVIAVERFFFGSKAKYLPTKGPTGAFVPQKVSCLPEIHIRGADCSPKEGKRGAKN